MGTPDSQDMIDLMLYLQELARPTFTVTPGHERNLVPLDRDGEGFLIDVAPRGRGLDLVATYYTYDGMGNQVWMIGNALAQDRRSFAKTADVSHRGRCLRHDVQSR